MGSPKTPVGSFQRGTATRSCLLLTVTEGHPDGRCSHRGEGSSAAPGTSCCRLGSPRAAPLLAPDGELAPSMGWTDAATAADPSCLRDVSPLASQRTDPPKLKRPAAAEGFPRLQRAEHSCSLRSSCCFRKRGTLLDDHTTPPPSLHQRPHTLCLNVPQRLLLSFPQLQPRPTRSSPPRRRLWSPRSVVHGLSNSPREPRPSSDTAGAAALASLSPFGKRLRQVQQHPGKAAVVIFGAFGRPGL